MSYWDRVRKGRLSRRKAIIGTAGFGGAAVFLAACGSDDASTLATGGGTGGNGTTGAGSGLYSIPEDTFEQAVRGGTLLDIHAADPPTLDPASAVNPLNPVARHVYGTLVRENAGYQAFPDRSIGPDLAESWETSPDGMEITLSLRPGVRWHNKAPVDGREIDIDDVLFSWNRYTELSPFRALSFNGANPDAPILSVEATDASTLLVKLKEPLAYALNYFGIYGSFSGNVVMLPKEADGGFDLRHNMIGHGPFVLEEYLPSSRFILNRNQDYYDQDFALIDRIEMPVVTEYAARLAQLKAGNVHRLIPNAQDVLSAAREQPQLQLYQTDFAASPWILVFGQLPAGESPFTDERVRQAVSMAIDRDLWIDALYDVAGFENAGLPIETRWNSHLLAQWGDLWLDPQSPEFGENARYFQFNLEEARALLAAAGYADGFEVTSTYPAVVQFNLSPQAEPMDGLLQELNIRINVNTPDYTGDYIPNYRDAQGQFDGWLYSSVTGTTPQLISPASALAAEYWSKGGGTFRGFSADTSTRMAGDPDLDRLIERARLERDQDAQRELLHDIQRHLGKAMWGLSMPGGASGYDLAWPAVRNHRVWRASAQPSNVWNAYRLWIDESQPPF